MAGADSWDGIEDFGNAKVDWLGTFLDLPNGIPSQDSLRHRFQRLDPDEFRRGSLGWIEALHEANERQVIAIDGKTLRRSFVRAMGMSALHMVHEHEDVPPFSFHYLSAMSARSINRSRK